MESIGTLAGGIAHDFNNLLMGIQGRTSLISQDLPPDHRSREHLRRLSVKVRHLLCYKTTAQSRSLV